MPAIRKPLEPDEMRRQCRGEFGLALDRMDRIVFAAHDEGRTPDALQFRKEIKSLALAARPCEPLQHLLPADRAARHVRMAGSAEIVRKRQPPPGVQRGFVMAPHLEE